MAKLDLTRRQKIALGHAIMNQMGDIFYEPWDYAENEPPEGFDAWTDAAIAHVINERAVEAAEGALGWLSARKGK